MPLLYAMYLIGWAATPPHRHQSKASTISMAIHIITGHFFAHCNMSYFTTIWRCWMYTLKIHPQRKSDNLLGIFELKSDEQNNRREKHFLLCINILSVASKWCVWSGWTRAAWHWQMEMKWIHSLAGTLRMVLRVWGEEGARVPPLLFIGRRACGNEKIRNGIFFSRLKRYSISTLFFCPCSRPMPTVSK